MDAFVAELDFDAKLAADGPNIFAQRIVLGAVDVTVLDPAPVLFMANTQPVGGIESICCSLEQSENPPIQPPEPLAFIPCTHFPDAFRPTGATACG